MHSWSFECTLLPFYNKVFWAVLPGFTGIHQNFTVHWQFRMWVGGSLAWLCLLLRWVCIEVFETVFWFETQPIQSWRSSCDGFLNVFPLLTFCMADSFLASNQDTKPVFWGSVTKPVLMGQCYQTRFSGKCFTRCKRCGNNFLPEESDGEDFCQPRAVSWGKEKLDLGKTLLGAWEGDVLFFQRVQILHSGCKKEGERLRRWTSGH